MRAPPAADISRELLAYLRTIVGDDVGFAEPPVRFGAGVESRVYGFRLTDNARELRGPLVVKVFGGAPDPTRARIESVICNTIADLGFPAPRVLHACADADPLGAPFIIMERLPGDVMLEPLTSTGTRARQIPALIHASIIRMPNVVAAVMARLHGVDADVVRRRLVDEGVDTSNFSLDARLSALRDRIDGASLGNLAAAVRWLEDARPDEGERPAICHGDLWHGNILERDGEVTGVLDWSAALVHIGDPAYDVGVTSIMLTASVPDVPRALRPLARWLQPRIAGRLVHAYARLMPLDRAAVGYYQLLHCVEFLEWMSRRRTDLTLRSRDEPDLIDIPEQPREFIARFARATGITLTMPPALVNEPATR
jgi:aminoglycoside phosphotransferase (APT) family kinase protein